jgi:hypothetical protein
MPCHHISAFMALSSPNPLATCQPEGCGGNVVVPNLPGKGPRFWLNTLLGDTQSRNTKAYIASLALEQRAKWPNWYLAYGGYLIVLMAVIWCLILLVAR